MGSRDSSHLGNISSLRRLQEKPRASCHCTRSQGRESLRDQAHHMVMCIRNWPSRFALHAQMTSDRLASAKPARRTYACEQLRPSPTSGKRPEALTMLGPAEAMAKLRSITCLLLLALTTPFLKQGIRHESLAQYLSQSAPVRRCQPIALDHNLNTHGDRTYAQYTHVALHQPPARRSHDLRCHSQCAPILTSFSRTEACTR
ncbi:hypothetical protein GY45DRAFT_444531 [Cubamyces sp. BRFM 1775]|nr:hypothetical protein GY45DRAFT_444531 [Cubamyces sp. BRFM 1775]